MVTIQAGIITETAKAELEKAEQERKQRQARLNVDTHALAGILDFLPAAADRFKAMVDDLENVIQRGAARARTQIKAILGDSIRLVRIGDHVDAELTVAYAGFAKVALTDCS